MTFKGQVPIRSKIVVDNTILEQVDMFAYLGCKISHKEETDITKKQGFANFGNYEQCFETKVSPKTILIESM
jgi:hypothetical protein